MLDEMYHYLSGTAAAFQHAQEANLEAATRTLELMTNAYSRWWGLDPQPVMPADKRFANDAWSQNPALDTLKQTYLVGSRWMMDLAHSLRDVDPALHQRAVFYTKQFADALSPSNIPALNPAVVEQTVQTGGANLVAGMTNLVSDVLDGKIRQVPKGAFTLGKDIAVTPGQVVLRNKLIELIQYAPTTEKVNAIPILIIPPWINKYYILDLRPKNSMVKYLVDAGFTVFICSWKNPDSSLRDATWEDYMVQGPLDAVKAVQSITGAERVNMVGYCIGGILLETVSAHWAAKGDPVANTTTYLATHQDFDNVGDLACFISPPEVMFLDWLMTLSGGYLDGKNMGATFDFLRANDLLWSYVINNYYMGKEPAAFDILHWNSDNTRVPQTLHIYYLNKFFLEKRLAQPNGLTLLGTGIDLKKITTPTFAVAMAEDHIVPWKSAYKIRELVSGPVVFTLAESGHIAGVLNPPAARARGYWCENCDNPDPDKWLGQCSEHHVGSWWENWVDWLNANGNRKVAPPSMGNHEFPPLVSAPGTYVLET